MLGRELRSAVWLGTIQATRVLAGFVVGIIVVRYLGAEQYGALMLALGLSGFFAAFGNLGLPRVLLKELTVPRADGRPVIATAIVLQVLGGAIGVGGTFAVCRILDKSSEVTLMAVLFAVALLFTGGTLLQQVFLSVHRVRSSAGANVTALVAALGYRVSLVGAQAGVVWFALANLVQNLVFLAVSLRAARPVLREMAGRLRPDAATARLLLAGGGPLFVASLLHAIPLYSDRVIIAERLSLADVGLYAVLIQLIQIPQMLIASFVGGASPRLIPTLATPPDAESGRRAGDEAVFLLGAATSAGLLLLVGLAVVAPVAVPLIYGAEFRVDPVVIGLLCLGMLVNIPNTLRTEFLLVRNRQVLTIVIGALHAAVTLALQIVLIARFGLVGAAAAYTLQAMVFAAFLNHLFPTLRPYRRLYWRALASGVTLVPLVRYVRRLIAERRRRDEGAAA